MLIHRLLATLLVALTAVVFTSPAANAAPRYNYVGWAGGTLIRAVGSTVTSDLTSQSYVAGIKVPNAAQNNVASVHVGDIANTGEVETSERVKRFDGGVKLISRGRTVGIDLLDGLITADAAITKTVTTAVPGERMRTRSHTRFVGLHIIGVDLPVDLPKNFKVSIDGVATIIANGQETTRKDGTTMTTGYGLKIVLLSAFDNLGLKSVIFLNPTFAGIAPEVPVNAPRVLGFAYGTRVHTSATSEIQIDSGRTANVSTPPGGTNDTTIINSTAQVNIPNVLNVGGIYSTSRSFTDSNFGKVRNINEIAGVNVLNGLIRADAIKVIAHATRKDNKFAGRQVMKFVNLVIAGNEIPIDVSPNTKITIGGLFGDLAVVTINKRYRGKQYVGITGLKVKLLQPRGDLPAGAIIRVSEALAWITPNGM
jgi:hypothetical protein